MLLSTYTRKCVQFRITLILALTGLVATLMAGSTVPASARETISVGKTIREVGLTANHLPSTTGEYDCTEINVPFATVTAVQGINDRGDIVGQFTANKVTRGFLLPKRGSLVVIDHPGSTFTSALAINSEGLIIGNWEDAVHQRRGFIWTDGRFTDVQFPGSSFTSLPSLNERGDMAGRYIFAGQPHGFTFIDGVYATLDVPGASDTAIFDLSSDGRIGGNYITGGLTHGFVLSGNEITTIDWPTATGPGSFSVRGITPGGHIVVGSYHDPTTLATHGFILVKGELTNFDYPFPAPGQVVSSTAIFGINSRGTFVGAYNVGGSVSSNFQHGYVCR